MTTPAANFGDRLADAVRARGPACVGIDPRPDWLPEDVLREGDIGATLRAHGEAVVEVVADAASTVKLNCAFFERHGADGWSAMLSIARAARARGLVTIADAKRSDIGPSAAAYADAFLGDDSPFDAVTVVPWLGEDGLTPFIDAAHRGGRGIFCVLRSSNPGAERLQEVETADDGPLWESLGRTLAAAEKPGSSGLGALGAVVGATVPDAVARARRVLPAGWLLLPGYGAQGGGAAAIVPALDEAGLGAIVNASRSVVFPWRADGEAPGPSWRDRVRAALDAMNSDLGSATRRE